MRILVTGSRDWDDWRIIVGALVATWRDYDEPPNVTLVHGCARGADSIAALAARRMGWHCEGHTAPWEIYGKSAGMIRNRMMVKSGADICLAFIKNESRGATGCADYAEKAGILVRRYVC